MSKFERYFGTFVIKRRWWIILFTILLFVLSSSGMQFLSFNNDTRVFFSDQNPQLKALEALEYTYTKNTGVVFVIAPKDKNIFTPKTLAAVEELTSLSWKMPFSSRVDSLANFQHTKVKEDELIVQDLVQNAVELTEKEIEQTRKTALSEPQLVNRLISPSGHVTSININMLLPGKSPAEVSQVAHYARNMAQNFRQANPDIDLYLTGGIMSDNAFGEVGMKDMGSLIPLMFLTLIVITGLAIGSFTGTIGTLIIILASMITAMGIAGWQHISITSASANAPMIILTLAVADSIHILVTLFQHLRLGKSKHDAIAESLRINFQPVLLTSATTAVGFLTLNFSDAPPFRDLGNIVTMGIIAAFIYSTLLLPALMAVLPIRVKAKKEKKSNVVERLAEFIILRRNAILPVMVGLVVVLSAGVLKIELNDDWMKYFDKSYDIRIASDFVEDNLTGADVIEYSLESGQSGGISNPEYLATIENFANWYREQPKVVHVSTYSDVIKRLNKNMHNNEDSHYSLPLRQDLAAQYLLLYEMSLPFGLDLNNQINVDKSATRMLVTLKNTNTTELRKTDENARHWLQTNAPESMFTYGSGLSIIWAHISERNINSMLGASFGALALISLILIVALRSFKLGIISLVPNLAPAFMAFGIWGMIAGQVGLGIAVIAAMTLGIVVDDTVHFLSKYQRARKEYGMDSPDAVRYSFKTVGSAIFITTLALVVGFSILMFSGFKMNSDMGLLTAITIILALILDFFFLPALLMRIDKDKYPVKEGEKQNETNIHNIDTLYTDSDAISIERRNRKLGG